MAGSSARSGAGNKYHSITKAKKRLETGGNGAAAQV